MVYNAKIKEIGMDKIHVHFSQVSEGMSLMDREEIVRMVEVLRVVKKQRGTVYLFGNGGSHATAGHFANDLMKMCGIRAVCVGDMASAMMEGGNVTGWEILFYGRLWNMEWGVEGVGGISCGGGSANVNRALRAARDEWGVLCGGMTGLSSGSEINMIGLDALIHARFPDIRVQEDLHLMVCHAMVRMIQEAE